MLQITPKNSTLSPNIIGFFQLKTFTLWNIKQSAFNRAGIQQTVAQTDVLPVEGGVEVGGEVVRAPAGGVVIQDEHADEVLAGAEVLVRPDLRDADRLEGGHAAVIEPGELRLVPDLDAVRHLRPERGPQRGAGGLPVGIGHGQGDGLL